MDVKKEFSNGQQTFWTACPFCKLRYQYYRNIVDRALICQRCKQPFIAYDVDGRGMPSEANNNLLFPPKKEYPSTHEFCNNTTKPKEHRDRETTSRMRIQENIGNMVSKNEGNKHSNVGKEDRKETKAKEHKDSEKEVVAEKDNETGPDPDILEVRGAGTMTIPNPDFFNFDVDREEKCIAVGQIWAVFDDIDLMPRFYALVKKVLSTPGFKVQITWLNPYPDDTDEIAWQKARLPIACGKFKFGKTENQEDIRTFSHKVDMNKKTVRGSLWVYPRKGETWALFKNWDIKKWNSDPDNHRNYEYDFVEVLSDYTKESGINVAYLVKIEGFVSLFKPTRNNGKQVSSQIPPNERFRFSHRVPSYKTTGREREHIPEGYFELDPSSLPRKILRTFSYTGVKVDVESSVDDSPISLADDELHTQNKGNSKRGSELGGNGISKMKKPTEESSCYPSDKTSSGLELDGVRSGNASTLGRKSELTCQADHVNVNSGSGVEKLRSSASHQDPSEIQEPEFHNFNDDKSHEKFKHGQIWALNCELDRFPRYYAQIERVELSPNFKLFIKWVEACAPPKNVIQWVDKKIPLCCGTFTSGGNAEFADTSSFSHLSTGVSANKENKYEIYPRKGEVWALYRNFNRAWTCSDLQKCEYDMVEVLEVQDARWILVLALQHAGFGTVFEADRKSGRELVMGIPWNALLTFSHQVPAFQLTESIYRNLRGCWVIDPKAMAQLV